MSGYFGSSSPSSNDAAAIAIVSLLRIGAPLPVTINNSKFGDAMAAFAVREASVALNDGNECHLTNAYLALDLSRSVRDIRDRLISFAPIRHLESQFASAVRDLPHGCSEDFRITWEEFRNHDSNEVLNRFGWQISEIDGLRRYQWDGSIS
jgi:hypothetical protein